MDKLLRDKLRCLGPFDEEAEQRYCALLERIARCQELRRLPPEVYKAKLRMAYYCYRQAPSEDSGKALTSMHGPWGPQLDTGLPSEEDRANFQRRFEEQARQLRGTVGYSEPGDANSNLVVDLISQLSRTKKGWQELARYEWGRDLDSEISKAGYGSPAPGYKSQFAAKYAVRMRQRHAHLRERRDTAYELLVEPSLSTRERREDDDGAVAMILKGDDY